MSFEQIECTLRTLGLANKSSCLTDKNPLSRQKLDQYFAQHQNRIATAPAEESGSAGEQEGTSEASEVESSSQKSGSQSRASSNMSRYKARKSVCPNCHKENSSDYGNAPADRIKYLEKRIRMLEKEIEGKGRSLPKLPQQQYFTTFKPQQLPKARKQKQQSQFVAMCQDMVCKLTKIQEPSLKYCWKFIKTNISNSLKGQTLTVDFPKSPVKRKIEFILHQTRDVLGVRKNQSIPETVRKLKEENGVLNKVYEKILKLFQLKVTHPHMLAYYLEDYTDRINRFESEPQEE